MNTRGSLAAPSTHGLRVRLLLLVSTLLWALLATSPWVSQLHPGLFLHQLDQLWFAVGTGFYDGWLIAHEIAGWTVVALLLSLGRHRGLVSLPGTFSLALVVLVVRLMSYGHPSTHAEMLLALPVALFACAALMASTEPGTRAAVALGACLLVLLVEQLQPGWSGGADHGWSFELWRFHRDVLIESTLFFAWFGWTLVAAGQMLTARPALWALLAAGAVVVTEWSQLGQIGRFPELEPVLIASAAAAAAAWISARPPQALTIETFSPPR